MVIREQSRTEIKKHGGKLVIFLFFAANKIIENIPYLEKGKNQMEERNVSVDAMDEIKELIHLPWCGLTRFRTRFKVPSSNPHFSTSLSQLRSVVGNLIVS